MSNRKNIFMIFCLTLNSSILFGQLAIGKKNVEGSGLIDFQLETTNGIILPHVEDVNKMTEVSEGTFVFDELSTKVMYFDGISWIDMNGIEGMSPLKLVTNEGESKTGVIIGKESSDTTGVLVLESDERALILPKIETPSKNVKSPYAGMICYDTISDNLYIFNGKYWTFWGIEDNEL